MEAKKVETDITAYPSRAPEFTTIFDGVRVVHLFRFFFVLFHYVVSVRIITIFSSSLTPVVCKSAHVLFTLFVFVCVWLYPMNIVLCFCFVFHRLCCQLL